MNPELQRNLWLEARPRQLAGAGLVLALIFIAVWLVDRGRDAHAFVLAGGAVFVVAGLFWAPREARASVTHEVYARTWDFQRLSSLSPWTMTWGKLAGATSRTWLFAGVGLLIAFLQLASITSAPHALYWAFIGVGLAVLMQASGMAVGLTEIRKARALGRLPGLRSPGLWLLGLALLGAGLAAWAYAHARFTGTLGQEQGLSILLRPISWWGHDYDPSAFAAFSLLVFGAWAVAWAWRLMRLELQLRNAPLCWPPFVLFAGLYAAGFASSAAIEGASADTGQPAPAPVVAALVFAICAYIGAFIDPADRVEIRRFVASLRRGWLKEATPQLPLIIAPGLLCAVSVAWAAVAYWRAEEGDAAIALFAMLAFVIRDLGLIAVMRFAPRGRGGDVSAFVALLLLYAVGGIVGHAFGGDAGGALFGPSSRHAALSLTAGGMEAVLLWAFAAWRIAQPSQRAVRIPAPQPTAITTAAPPAEVGVRPWR